MRLEVGPLVMHNSISVSGARGLEEETHLQMTLFYTPQKRIPFPNLNLIDAKRREVSFETKMINEVRENVTASANVKTCAKSKTSQVTTQL